MFGSAPWYTGKKSIEAFKFGLYVVVPISVTIWWNTMPNQDRTGRGRMMIKYPENPNELPKGYKFVDEVKAKQKLESKSSDSI